jgi:hypothetical protein
VAGLVAGVIIWTGDGDQPRRVYDAHSFLRKHRTNTWLFLTFLFNRIGNVGVALATDAANRHAFILNRLQSELLLRASLFQGEHETN